MKIIPNFHNFIDDLPEAIRSELEGNSIVRHVGKEQPVYRQGDEPNEMYQLLQGSVRMCNYSYEGKEAVMGHFRPGDCFGEMGLIDGLPRMSHAVATEASQVRVLGKPQFDKLYRTYPEISRQMNLMLCNRVRLLWGMTEDASTLSLHQRLARAMLRLAYSHGIKDADGALHVDTSHEELGRMLGASRQSISKELKILEQEETVEIRYGKIYIRDLDRLKQKYDNLLGQEQISPLYSDSAPEQGDPEL